MSDYKSAAEMIEFQAAELRNRDEALARVVRERDAAIRDRDALESVLVRVRTALGLSEDAMGWHMIEWAERLSQIQQEHVVALQERDEAIRERDLARAHDAQPYPTAEAYERVCAALEATKRSLEQTRAAMEAGDARTVCAGTGKPVSGKPCICGGHGGIGNQIIGLTREAQRERERADRAEALLREIAAVPLVGLTLGSVLLAKIREALGD